MKSECRRGVALRESAPPRAYTYCAMKIGLLIGSVLPVVLLAACGGGEPQQTTTPPAGKTSPPSAGGSGAAGTGQQQKPKKPKRIRRPKIDDNMVKIFFGNETAAPAAPVESTPELVALGKQLYHTEVLSKNGNLSCASCHDLATYGVDNKPTSPGSTGENGDRNSPTTYNAFRQYAQFWDGRAKAVEDQSLQPLINPIEHGLADEAEVVTKLKAQAELVEGFQQAFPGNEDPVTAENFGIAVGAFERTLVTRSKWDDYLDGNKRALSNLELLGLKTFMEVNCTQCHLNRTLGGQMPQKLGLLKPYGGEDTGRERVTGNVADKYIFKVPTLLNVAKTAPYYHDGKIKTLREAVTNMADIQLNKKLTDEQTDAIVAFLEALTGPIPEEFAK